MSRNLVVSVFVVHVDFENEKVVPLVQATPSFTFYAHTNCGEFKLDHTMGGKKASSSTQPSEVRDPGTSMLQRFKK